MATNRLIVRFFNTQIKQYLVPKSLTSMRFQPQIRLRHDKPYAKEAKRIRFYFLHRYLEHIRNYDKVLEKRFPSAVLMYRLFMSGVKDFYADLKQFVSVVRILHSAENGFKNLTRREIELYHQMPKDIMKVAPILLIAALPFTNYIVLPLIYMFPKQLLSSHFWNLQQKSEFSVLALRDRLMHHRPVFRHMQGCLENLRGHKLYECWKEILGELGSGVQPDIEQIIDCKELFAGQPYSLMHLNRNHMKHLLLMHDMRAGLFWRKRRLKQRARILLEMDRAIMREGGVVNLQTDALRRACLIRGLNPSNLRNDELTGWLQKWMIISKEVDEHCYSLLLHTPILLGYNEQSNWTLIYKFKT